MVETNKEQPLGATLLWSVSGDVPRASLKAAWEAVGFGKYVPAVRRPNTVLGDALERRYTNRKASNSVIVRPLSGRTGFAIVDESRGLDANDYATRMSVKVVGDDLSFTNVEAGEQDLIREAFQQERLLVNPGQLGSALAKAVMEGLSGVPLRPSGGVYWVPAERLDRYHSLAAATAQAGSGAVLYSMTNRIDVDTLATVRDAAIESLSKELDDVREKLMSETITERGVEARQDEIRVIEKKILLYEAVLQDRLPEVREKLDAALTVKGLAGIMAMAAG